MAVAALKHKPQLKTFYATMHVTRIEEWFVEAESAAEARELPPFRCRRRSAIGECVHAELEQIAD